MVAPGRLTGPRRRPTLTRPLGRVRRHSATRRPCRRESTLSALRQRPPFMDDARNTSGDFMKNRNLIIIGAVVVLALGGAGFAAMKSKGDKATAVDVTPVKRAKIVQKVNGTGKIQ